MFDIWLIIAHALPAHIYGIGDMYCGDYDTEPIPCDANALTASGKLLEPDKAQLALSLPKNKKLQKGIFVWLKLPGGKCTKIELVDKANEKWIGFRFGDLTPGAVKAMGSTPTEYWSSPVFLCGPTLEGVKN